MFDLTTDIIIRRYQEGDEYQINELFNTVFHQRRSLEEWQWKFKKSPFGASIIFVAEYKRQIVSHMASIPVKIKIGKNIFTCYQSLDAMVIPHFEARWVFAKVFRAIQNEMNRINQMHLGFPHKKAHDIETKRLGAISVGKVELFTLPIARNVLETQGTSDRSYKITEIKYFDQRFDDLWVRMADVYPVVFVRNQTYLNWRYVQDPDRRYRFLYLETEKGIAGYSVLKMNKVKEQTVGYIVDFFAEQEESIVMRLVSEIITYFKNRRVELLVWYLKDNFITDILMKCGFLKNEACSQSGIYLSDMWLIARNYNPLISDETLYDINNWFIMLGDSDWQ